MVEIHLLCRQLQRDVAHDTLRELHVAFAAAVADHDGGERLMQLILIFDRTLANDKVGGEFAVAAELSWLEQCDEVVQLLQIILDGGSGQQKTILFAQPGNELIVGRFLVFELMRLVNDEHVVIGGQEQVTMRLPLGRVDGRHDNIAAPRMGSFLSNGSNAELAVELPHPLKHERCRNEDERPLHEAAHEILLEYQSRFNRLAKSHFIRENGSSPHVVQHFHRRVDLMLHRLKPIQEAERLQLLEALDPAGLLRLHSELIQRPIVPWTVALQPRLQIIEPAPLHSEVYKRMKPGRSVLSTRSRQVIGSSQHWIGSSMPQPGDFNNREGTSLSLIHISNTVEMKSKKSCS